MRTRAEAQRVIERYKYYIEYLAELSATEQHKQANAKEIKQVQAYIKELEAHLIDLIVTA